MTTLLDDDFLSFASEDDADSPQGSDDKWRMLVVDDDPGILQVTRLAMSGFEFDGKGLQIIEATSAAEARRCLAEHDDIAVAMIDVIMESEHAGLELVRHIRETLGNRMVRLILRTGQPGNAPEREVIRDYDINDYKEKTELTVDKMFSAVYSSLRAYRDITALETNRRGLEQVIHNCGEIYRIRALRQFASGALEQLTALLFLEPDALYLDNASLEPPGYMRVVAASGAWMSELGKTVEQIEPAELRANVLATVEARHSLLRDRDYVSYATSESEVTAVIVLRGKRPLSADDAKLIEVFCRNVSIAHENLLLKEDIDSTQKELVLLLAEAVETRSPETGYHVRRVGEYAAFLGRKMGLSEDEAELLRRAAPLHDLGKLGIPDAILHKTGKLTPDEWDLMRQHPSLGENILGHSKRRLLQAASIFAAQHHERWDGSGYPRGLKGKDIHLYGRIGALVDAFDALGSYRSYKEPWPMDDILKFINDQCGVAFDPDVVDCFMQNLPEVLAIRDRYRDAEEHRG